MNKYKYKYKYIERLNKLEEKLENGSIDIEQAKTEFNEIVELFHEETGVKKGPKEHVTQEELELTKPLLKFYLKYRLY